ncbi:adenine deaminase C-terminal domain-containing protein [Sporosarcina thermotolerans]|uniref:adenine deaminase n=1 Tax=Sporosarcina thermotolerans TaxID=633404 RepID=A0AAW9AC23_9BACL|nr:adenine deaminase C-terminal domain-containing protein [Sporosarcina thermotolerans]MDW0117915.1 adenine deaminase C-terminal domain-containing protein [Sporosarcina thermotolerans]
MWDQREIQQQLGVINGKLAPDLIIQNATYLHSIFKKWVTGNIWIKGDRIVYAGDRMPAITEGTEIVDATNKKIVPGYIEPHVHPFQLYNPETFAEYAGRLGTTTFLSDNLTFFLLLGNEKAFKVLEQLRELPFSFYWWARFDSQTVLQDEKEVFNQERIAEWLKRDDVLMGGELTGWPRLMNGDPDITASLIAAKKAGKKIEGHFPGSSERTLARMKLLGVDGDHEAMTVEEVEARLQQGFAVTLRHSSIRPDLPQLLNGILEKGHDVFDHLMMTTDGSTPSFHMDGVMDKCIQVALDAGVNPIDAYLMASYNIARYYDITDLHGVIATGRYATLNFLKEDKNPVPTDVLSKGKWLKRNNEPTESFENVDWSAIPDFKLDFDLGEKDFEFSHSVGINMVNDVITKPYEVTIDLSVDRLSDEHDESFLMLIDRNGKWRVNTVIKGFADHVQGFASSYSNTGDIILIGKDKREMFRAFREMKQMRGGMVLHEDGKIAASIPLPISGGLSAENVEVLIEQELKLKKALLERGYKHGDAVYTFLFLQSTHLPYVRATQIGLYNVMKNEVIIPSKER